MNAVARWFRTPRWQRFGKRSGIVAKRLLGGGLDLVLPTPPNRGADSMTGVRRVLLVRPNHRIGNTLLATPLIEALHARFPGAQLAVLSSDSTSSLLAHLPIDEVHAISRSFILRPWRFVGLFRRLRRERFDVAVDGGMGSFSGSFYAYLTGAPHRVGIAGSGDRFLTVRLERIAERHVYDHAPAFARRLGVGCADRPVFTVSAAESGAADTLLARIGVMDGADAHAFVALFVGGHQHKRWPAERWVALARELGERGVRWVALIGPEERGIESDLRAAFGPSSPVVSPQPLRTFAAIMARARVVVTPDSGPMHLAAALERPTVAILQTERSMRFRPRGPTDLALLRPSVDEVAEAVSAHPACPRPPAGARTAAGRESPRPSWAARANARPTTPPADQ